MKKEKQIKKTILNSLHHFREFASLYGNTIEEIEEAVDYINKMHK